MWFAAHCGTTLRGGGSPSNARRHLSDEAGAFSSVAPAAQGLEVVKVILAAPHPRDDVVYLKVPQRSYPPAMAALIGISSEHRDPEMDAERCSRRERR
jgi:hypothetical protein